MKWSMVKECPARNETECDAAIHYSFRGDAIAGESLTRRGHVQTPKVIDS